MYKSLLDVFHYAYVTAMWIQFNFEIQLITRSYLVSLVITNLGVTNVGMIGACEFLGREVKERRKFVEHYLEKTNAFIKFSSVLSFLHHTTVLSIILGLVAQNPEFFEHWKCKKFLLRNYDGYFYEHMYYIFSIIITLGFISLLLSIYQGARGLKIVHDA